MARVFVTGANGFIGSHLVGRLLQDGHDVIGLVRPTSDLRSLEDASRQHGARLALVTGDIRDADRMKTLVRDVEYVFHLAAELLGTSEREFFDPNTTGTRNVLEAAWQNRTPAFKRFVFTSSQAAAGPAPTSTPIDESRPTAPVSHYGRSKAAAETIALEYHDKGLPVTIGRPVAVYGDRERDLSGGTFGIVAAGFKPMVGFQRKTVSFVHVTDLVNGLIAAATSDHAAGKIYFFGNPQTYKDTDIVGAIADGFGTKVRIPLITPHAALRIGAVFAEWVHHFTRGRPALTADKVREVKQRYWAASPARAKQDIGWEADITLRDGMRETVRAWQRDQERAGAWHEPLRDRAIKTYTISTAIGIALETTAYLADGYRFDPWWVIFIVIFAVIGGLMGTVSLLSIRHAVPLQFLWGALVGVSAELGNTFWFHLWEFNADIMALLPDPWIRSIAFGLPAGIMPVLVNALIGALYRDRLRLG